MSSIKRYFLILIVFANSIAILTAAAQEITQEQWNSAGVIAASELSREIENDIQATSRALEDARLRTDISSAHRETSPPTRGGYAGEESRYTVNNRSQQEFLIKHHTRRLLFLKKQLFNLPKWHQPILHLNRPEVGAFGQISYIVGVDEYAPNPELKIKSNEKLPSWAKEYLERELPIYGHQLAPMVVFQVIDEATMLLKSGGNIYMLEGADTSGLVDGANLTVKNFVRFSGTKTYPTALGTKTVFTLELVPEQAVAILQAGVPEQLKRHNRVRTWTALKGGYTTEAELIDFKANRDVVLRKLDGTEITVPFNTFINDDRDYVNTQLGIPR